MDNEHSHFSCPICKKKDARTKQLEEENEILKNALNLLKTLYETGKRGDVECLQEKK